MIITKNHFLELAFHIGTNRFLFKRTSKITFFPGFFMIALRDTAASDGFFSKKYASVTFDIGNFARHATYHSKALEEQISNIYTFIGEKPFNFNIKILIIFGTVPKIYLNSLSHEYYQKLFVGISILYMYQSIPFLAYIKKNIFSRFFHVWFTRYCRFRCFFSQKIFITNFSYMQLCTSCDIPLQSF